MEYEGQVIITGENWSALSKDEQDSLYRSCGGKIKFVPTPHKRMDLGAGE